MGYIRGMWRMEAKFIILFVFSVAVALLMRSKTDLDQVEDRLKGVREDAGQGMVESPYRLRPSFMHSICAHHLRPSFTPEERRSPHALQSPSITYCA